MFGPSVPLLLDAYAIRVDACRDLLSECCTEMATGESPFETVDSLLLWLVYFALPVTFIAVRQVLTKRECVLRACVKRSCRGLNNSAIVL